MLSSIAEGIIQRVCGRYLKNFNSNNISIGVTGIITLTNIELRVDELDVYQLPYKPIRLFIGSLYADLPIVLGGNFDIRVSDVLLVLERGENIAEVDPALIHRALQAWIGGFFFAFANQPSATAQKVTISSSEVEYSQKLFDRLMLTLENIHVRLEERVSFHISTSSTDEWLCTGLQISKLSLRNPASSEAGVFDSLKGAKPSSGAAVLDKVLQVEGLSAYCAREPALGRVPDATLNLEFVKKSFHPREVGTVLKPMNIAIVVRCAYQRSNLVFGPVLASGNISDIEVHLNDEQVVYLLSVIRNCSNQANNLKLQARIAHCEECPDASRRARMRWGLLRDSVRRDWWTFCSELSSGRLRWRAWFKQWVMAARYIAIREVLLFYAGYEAVRGLNGDVLSYSFSECLHMDHHYRDFASLKALEEASGGMTKKQRRRYCGKGTLPPDHLEQAERIITSLIAARTKGAPYFSIDGQIPSAPTEHVDIGLAQYTPEEIRALYTLQLELDETLPLHVSALCRVWAEDLYREQRQTFPTSIETSIIDDNGIKSSGPDVGSQSKPDRPSSVLLLAIVDANNLQPTFGMSVVEATCTIESFRAGGSHSSSTTEAKSSKVYQHNNAACIGWGSVYEYAVNGDSASHKAVDTELLLKIECNGKGLFAPCYGHFQVPLKQLWVESKDGAEIVSQTRIYSLGSNSSATGGAANATATNATGLDFSSYFGNTFSFSAEANAETSSTSAADTSATVRLLTASVVGNHEAIQRAKAKLLAQSAEMHADIVTKLERQHQLALRESQRGSSDEEETFILDPSALTLQDCQANIEISSISVTIYTKYETAKQTLAASKSVGISLLPTCLVPLVRFQLGRIAASASCSNNPWRGRGQGSIAFVHLLDLSKSIADSSAQPRVLLSLPAITVSGTVMQTTTVSKFLDGSLDISCFDWSVNVAMEPFSVALKQQSLGSNKGDRISIWSKYRLLDHLWTPQSPWSVATATGLSSLFGGAHSPKIGDEGFCLLGDCYETFPKHINCVDSVSVGRQHIPSPAGSTNSTSKVPPPPVQSTGFRLATSATTLDINVQSVVNLDALVGTEEEGDEWDELMTGDGLSDSDNDESSPDVVSAGGVGGAIASGVEAGISGLVGGVAGGIDAGVSSMFSWVSFNAPAAAPAPQVAAVAPPAPKAAKAPPTIKSLEARIKELEQINERLQSENDKLRRSK